MSLDTWVGALAFLNTPAGRDDLFIAVLASFLVALIAFERRRKQRARRRSHGWHGPRPPAGSLPPAAASKQARAILKAIAARQFPAALYRLEFDSEPLEESWRIYHQALTYQLSGRMVEAEGYYRAILAAEPDHREAAYNLATLHLELAMMPEALMGFRRAIEHTPFDADSYFNMGQVYFHLKLYAEAANCWETVLTLEGDATDAEENLSWLKKLRAGRSPQPQAAQA